MHGSAGEMRACGTREARARAHVVERAGAHGHLQPQEEAPVEQREQLISMHSVCNQRMSVVHLQPQDEAAVEQRDPARREHAHLCMHALAGVGLECAPGAAGLHPARPHASGEVGMGWKVVLVRMNNKIRTV